MSRLASLLFLLAACASAEVPVAAPSPKPAGCTPLAETWNDAQLVGANFDSETLEGRAVYFRKEDETHGILFALLRDNCQAEWRAVKAIPVLIAKPACEPSETTQCL